MWYKNVRTSFIRFVTIHAIDRQTDRQTDGYTVRMHSQSHGENDRITKQKDKCNEKRRLQCN